MSETPVVRATVVPRLYRDSVTLMALATALEKLPGISRVGAVMATPGNLSILAASQMLPEGLRTVPDDLVVVVKGASSEAVDLALAEAVSGLTSATDDTSTGPGTPAPATIAEALASGFEATVATVSVPGAYAPVVVEQALNAGLHVFCFSDNVPLADEIRLKRLAASRRLLLMGPDCGTAIVDSVPLGFANVVRPGTVGVVAASGTGAQEVSVLLDAWGVGVSQLIGVGGRDLSLEVGGVMTHLALDLLAEEESISTLMVVSKPPGGAVADDLLARLAGLARPDRCVVACLLGLADAGTIGVDPLLVRGTLEGGARAAAILAGANPPPSADVVPTSRASTPGIVGLFTGGTLASEAKIILQRAGLVASIHDLGDDRYTAGKPHPMIDPTPRNTWIADLVTDDEVGVLLVDVVLGYGSHPDPAGSLVAAVKSLQAGRRARGAADLVVIASVTGTEADPQHRGTQTRALRDAGVLVATSNAAAARAAVLSCQEAS